MASEAPAGRLRRAAAVFLKIAAVAFALLAAIAIVGAAFVSSRYFTAAVEAELVKSVGEAKQRTLRFDGPLDIHFWPNAGFTVGRVSLSEAGSADEFASIDSARFSVAVLPLLQRRIVVGDCAVDGLKAAIVKRRDGTLNVDDLFVSKQPGGEWAIDAAAVRISHSTLSWTNQASGASTTASDLDFSGVRIEADTAAKTVKADGLSLSGRVGDMLLEARVDGLADSPAALTAERLALDIARQTAETAFKASLNGRLAADPRGETIAIDPLTGEIDLSHPRLAQPLKLPLRGRLQAQRDSARGQLSSHFDESTATLKFAVPRYSPMALHLDIDVDRLDLDRYLAAHRAADAEPQKTRDGGMMGLSALDGRFSRDPD